MASTLRTRIAHVALLRGLIHPLLHLGHVRIHLGTVRTARLRLAERNRLLLGRVRNAALEVRVCLLYTSDAADE